MIGLHDGGSIVMKADGPEEEIPFDGLGGLLCLKPRRFSTRHFVKTSIFA